jgi:UDP-glucose 4-epimerase
MKKVLITGGAGFIGGHVAAALLKQGHSVELVDNFSRGVEDQFIHSLLKNPNATLHSVDLLSNDCFNGFTNNYTHILHFAAILGVTKVLNSPYEVLEKNTKMLLNVLEFSKRQEKLERFLFASTSEVYAGTLKHFQLPIPTPESTPLALTDLWHPRTSYMLSKIYGEALVQQSSLPFTIIRPHNIYGPRMGLSHVIPELLKKTYTADPSNSIDVFSVNHKRTFCYIDDAVMLITRAILEKAGEGKVLNIGNQDPEVTIGELARTIIKIVNKKVSIRALEPTEGSPVRRCPDISSAKAVTGYSPQVDLAEGIEKTFRWYQSYVFKGNGPSAI